MRKQLFILLVLLHAILSYGQTEKKLAEAFIESIAKNNFTLLNEYLLNTKAAKNLFSTEFQKKSVSQQTEMMRLNKISIQRKWSKVVSNAKDHAIDFTKVQVTQILPGPIKGSNDLKSLLVTYKYKDVEWDDLLFIVNKQGASRFIIDIPSNTTMFSLDEEKRGKNLKELQLIKDTSDPKIKQHLKDAVELLKKLVAENNTSQLYNHLVYSGEEDKEYRWKRTVDAAKPNDVESAKRIIKKLKAGLITCNKINYGDVRMEKESEGVWYVINTACGDQNHTYAFLKINNEFALGDID